MNRDYYYIDEAGKQFGPYRLEMFRLLPLRPSTHVWRSGLPDWIVAEEMEELRGYLAEEAQTDPVSAAEAPEAAVASETLTLDQPRPKSWLTESILVTLFCSMVGLVAFFHALQVGSRYRMGDYEAAVRESAIAKRWLLIAMIVGVVVNVVYFFVFKDELMSVMR